MAITFQAHVEGKVIIPDEPIELRDGEKLEVTRTSDARPSAATIADRLARMQALAGMINVPGPSLESLRRENLYED
ncbi:MAG: hypothetical protein ABJA67_08020 [Chthonomonadales bacterium]